MENYDLHSWHSMDVPSAGVIMIFRSQSFICYCWFSNQNALLMLSGQLLLKSFVYNLPVDYFPYLGQMVGTAVLEVEVVGVLPYVERQDRG